jgi:citrate lyase subunit beta/citryl-CoA lyase
MRPCRSLLFVPGHKESWVPKAAAVDPDAVILDLEDSVPPDDKATARECVLRSIEWLRREAPWISIFVRPNALDTGEAGLDLAAVIVPGVEGLVLPKIDSARDVLHFEGLLDHFERLNGVPAGTVHFVPSLESARAYASCDELLSCSVRVHSLFAGVAQDADVARSIGFRATPEGRETLYLRSKALLAMRAADVSYPLVGLWQDVRDLDGARRFAQDQRELGYSGMVVIHPSHVAIANETFSLTLEELRYYRGIREAVDAATASGSGSVMFEGQHIDYAHAKTATALLRDHEELTRRRAPTGLASNDEERS